MDGDLFSSNNDFEKLEMVETDDFILRSIAISQNRTCKKDSGTIWEYFLDSGATYKLYEAGSLFCHTLNGKLVSFPETYKQLMSLLAYKTYLLDIHNVTYIGSAIDVKSYSVVPQKPDIGYPPNGLFENIFDIEGTKTLHPDKKVQSAISKDHHSYQSKEDHIPPAGFLQEHTHFVLQRCERYVGATVGCMFQRKIFLKVSGLCNFSPVDKIFTLMELDKNKADNYFQRLGTFSGLLLRDLQHLSLCLQAQLVGFLITTRHWILGRSTITSSLMWLLLFLTQAGGPLGS